MNVQLEEYQACDNIVRYVEVKVQSKSHPNTSYLISGVIFKGSLRCSCPGFHFKGTCSHVRILNDECGWDSHCDDKQTDWQRENHICPRCGSKTVDRLG